MLTWKIGGVTVTRIVEMEMPIAYSERHPFLVEATPAALRAHPWLYPNYVDDQDRMLLSIQALLVEAPGLRLVVDTCVGNDKRREFLGGQALSTPFLTHLEDAGWTRQSVDAVVCTHLHVDHVGWNTMLEGETWVPTFPNARYLIGRKEYDYWSKSEAGDQPQILADSVKPILNAGLADLVEMDHRISNEIRLTPSAGHTPGHVSVLIESEGRKAVITGDMTHHPCQLAHPDWSPPFDTDPKEATKVRKRMFAEWADGDILVIGTHYAAPTAGRVVRDGEAFRFET